MDYNLGPVNHDTQQSLQLDWQLIELAYRTTRGGMLGLLQKQNQRDQTSDLPCLAGTTAAILRLWDR